ncbi:MAG: hypothetical protein AB1342_02450 [Pseudomonadota bacterium]
MRRLLRPLWIVLALVFLIEAWLWDRLEPIVAWFVDRIPLKAMKDWFGDKIDHLSPGATLIVFVVPLIPLFPLKVIGLWLLAHKYFVSAVLVIVFAKLLGMGITAFVFDVTREKLLQMRWFNRLYEFLLWAREWSRAQMAPIKAALIQFRQQFRMRSSSRFVERLRRRVHMFR